MDIAKITSKGQLTLPIGIRKKLNLNTGDQVAFYEQNGNLVMVNVNRLTVGDSVNLAGIEASLNMEGLYVSKESKKYADERIKNNISHAKRIEQIKERYKQK